MAVTGEYILLGSALLLAIGDWIAVAKGWRIANYILKPAVMVVTLAWLGSAGGFSGWMIWFSIGTLFLLVGDVLLMLPQDRFLTGLIAFLCAHLAYIVGFNPALPPLNLSSLVLTVLLIVTAIQVYRLIIRRMRAAGQDKLFLPVTVYSIVLGLMILSALLTLARPEWHPAPAILVSAGAILFMLADTLLALNRFGGLENNKQVISLAAYHLGTFLIVLGAWLHYR